MGVDLQLLTLGMPRDARPDWEAAAEAIECLELATIWDNGEYFPWEAWLWDAPNAPAPVGTYTALREAQRQLHDAACLVRGAIDQHVASDSLKIELPQLRAFTTGGLSTGASPGKLFDAFNDFAQGGVARAAGIPWWTDYGDTPLDRRKLTFDAFELRSVKATQAFILAEDIVNADDEDTTGLSADQWLARLRATLDRAHDSVDDKQATGCCLLQFAAEVLALMLRLERTARDHQDDETIIRTHVDLLEDPGEPRRRSLRRVLESLDRRLQPFDELLPTIEGRGDMQLAADLEHVSGVSLHRAVSIELSLALLVPAVTAIADVFPNNMFDLRSTSRSVPIEPCHVPPPRSRRGRPSTPDPPYRDWIAWCAATALDWTEAEQHIETIDDVDRAQLTEDLREFRQVAEGEYNRYVVTEECGDTHLWMTAAHDRDGWTLVDPLRRLGAAGVLEAAGALAWG